MGSLLLLSLHHFLLFQGAHEARVSEAVALHEKIDGLLNKTSYNLLTAEVTLADQIKVMPYHECTIPVHRLYIYW